MLISSIKTLIFFGSSADTYAAIARGSSEAAWALSGGAGPTEGFDPFMLSTYAILSTVTVPLGIVHNFITDALGSF